jgi:AcrR family transcriptional regulator
MARPVAADSEGTRRRILEAAIGCFAEHGFAGASTREIAERAKVNAAMLSHYFGGKQGVYDATVDEVYRRLAARTGEVVAGASPARLGALLERIYDAAREERDGIRLLVRQVLDGGRLTAHTEAQHFLPRLDAIAKLAAPLYRTTPARARAAAVTLGYLVSRFVIQDERSLKAAFAARSTAEARARVIETLLATTEALLCASR